jgi:hypothetical protein
VYPGGSEVVRAVPPVPPGPDHVNAPIRFEKKWFQGLSVIRLAVAGMALVPFLFIIGLLVSAGATGEGFQWLMLLFLLLMLPIIIYFNMLILRTRPAAFEMDGTGVRLYRGDHLVKEIGFGPGVEVGIVMVGYWDDLSPGLTLHAAGMDENDVSMFDRRGFGPLFGYRFRGGGKKIVVSRKYGWDIRWIQWMWAFVMSEVGRHGMRLDRSALKYLEKRRRMGLPVP